MRPERGDRVERRLAARLRRGDPDGLAEVHRTYGGLVLGYLRNALHDLGAAEDVHQEVFLEVWRRGPDYDPDRASLGTWIMLIARSRAIDHLRHRIPEPRDPQTAGAAEREDPASSPDLLVERWALAVHLTRLPPEHARILRMRFEEGLSQTEIAERTGIPLGSVKTYMVRGLRRLRDLMEEDR
ncbi:MAG TPA: sigma-70 family RNA polymerase sigma factor [Miltoncostaea sp.]|jgi:RNA polymerase sigma-70 factor (ECF subfamily)|nr:sigma-70 family RNA polymerase sigma factor [Miltoncostaea sp.]